MAGNEETENIFGNDNFENVFVNSPLELPKRKSKDKINNKPGRQLLELCSENNFVILNGRSISDKNGEFTYISSLGSSVIDYTIVSQVLFNRVDLAILSRPESAHMPLKLEFTMGQLENFEKNSCLETFPLKHYKWSESKKDDFVKKIYNIFYLLTHQRQNQFTK